MSGPNIRVVVSFLSAIAASAWPFIGLSGLFCLDAWHGTACAQQTASAWIHLAETPDLFDPSAVRLDHYAGSGPNVYAFLVADDVAGGHVSGLECRHWITVENSSIQVGDLVLLGSWSEDYSLPGSVGRWPALPGEQTPSIIGYWPLTLLHGEDARGQIGLSVESGAGLSAPAALTETAMAVPMGDLLGAGINMDPPSPVLRRRAGLHRVSLGWAPGHRQSIESMPEVGTLTLSLRYPGRIRWGLLGLVIRDDVGVVTDAECQFGTGRSSYPEERGWIEMPQGDLPDQPGLLIFRHQDTGGIQSIDIDIPLRIPGPARPLTIEVPWIRLETPTGERTLLSTLEEDATATALGGVTAQEGYAVNLWEPRKVQAAAPFLLEFLGDELDQVTMVGLEKDGLLTWATSVTSGENGRALEADFPSGILNAGLYNIVVLPESSTSLPPGSGMLVESSGLRPEGTRTLPTWYTNPSSIAADYVIISTDAPGQSYWDQAVLFGTGLIEAYRPYETIALLLDDIKAAFPGRPTTEAIHDALAFAYQNWKWAPLFALIIGSASESDPSFNLVPTPHGTNEGNPCGNHDTYAMDAWYGDVVDDLEPHREISVGRVPARTVAELTAYGAKVNLYHTRATSRFALAFATGDFAGDEESGEALGRIADHATSLTGLGATILRVSDFMGAPPFTYEEKLLARDTTIGLFDQANLILFEFFGNILVECNTHLSGLLSFSSTCQGWPSFNSSLTGYKQPVLSTHCSRPLLCGGLQQPRHNNSCCERLHSCKSTRSNRCCGEEPENSDGCRRGHCPASRRATPLRRRWNVRGIPGECRHRELPAVLCQFTPGLLGRCLDDELLR